MSDATHPPRACAADPRDLKIAEQARTIAELRAQIKDLQKKLAKLEDFLASQAEAKSSKAPVFTEPRVHGGWQPRPQLYWFSLTLSFDELE